MKKRATTCEQVKAPGPRPRNAEYALLGAVCMLIISVYAWSARSGCLELWGLKAEHTYCNLLAQGVRAGQLNLNREAPLGLAQLADPYDPVANHPYRWIDGYPLEEMSYHAGRLYLYFGITPVLVLFWPCLAMAGHFLLHKQAVVIFFSAGFLTSVVLLWGLWRRYYVKRSGWVVVAGALAVGLANLTLASLQRCEVYEVAISCGYALTMVTLALLWRAMHAVQGRDGWLAAASLTYGLAVGARPSLLFGAVIFLVALAQTVKSRASGRNSRHTAHGTRHLYVWLATAVPILVIGLGLLLHNHLRFDNPLEFGQRYQLGQDRPGEFEQFSLRYLWFNFRVGFLEPARWGCHFPFVEDIALPPLPEGGVVEQLPFGILSNIPVVWLALAAPLACRGRWGAERGAVGGWVAMVALLFANGALVMLFHSSMTLRYQIEFLTALALLAVIGIFGLECAMDGCRLWQRAARYGWGVLLAWSLLFNLLAAFERYADAYVDLGRLLTGIGRREEALVQFQKALALHPGNAEACKELGVALLNAGQISESLRYLEEALRWRPDYAEAHNNLGSALLQQGRVGEAIEHLERAVHLKSEYVNAHNNLAGALFRSGRVAEAIGHYEKALRLKPGHSGALRNLAWILATCDDPTLRNGHRAVELAQAADRLAGGKDPMILDTLAAAYAEAGRFEEAVQAEQAAIDLARSAGQIELAEAMRKQLQLYQAGQPYHEAAAAERR